ncbi:MAG TPA: hypothetical protein VE377_17620 [Candidatus Dormibacteraeota bacterium]|nr:hypothetical protein [Candidatus Dormibacteraeota bacterium]
MATFPEPVRPRVAISEGVEGLRISIRPRLEWAVLFLVAWLCLWTYLGISRGGPFQHLGDFLGSWMLGWVFGEIWGTWALLHVIGWREIIVVKADSLTRKSEIFGLGFTKTYPASEMRNLRFQVATGRRNVSRLAFDYGSRTVTFASYLNRDEQVALLPRIRQRCPLADSQKPQESGIRFSGQ